MPVPTVSRTRLRLATGLLLLGLGCWFSTGNARTAEPEPASPAPPEVEKVSPLDLQGRVEDRAPVRSRRENEDEAKAYALALIEAHTHSAAAFANSARHDVTYAHLFEEPEKFRGQVIHLQGRLKRVRRFDAPLPDDVKPFGITEIYEGWIFDPEVNGANPWCVVFTDLPAGVAVKEELEVPVAVDGFFFKKYRYKAGDGHLHDVPLFIARTLHVEPRAGADASTSTLWSHAFVNGFLIVVGLTVALAVALTWWYRRGDRRVRSRIEWARRPAAFVEPEAVDGSESVPVDMPE